MIIIAWSPNGTILAIFEEDVFRNVLSIFITYSFLNLLRGGRHIFKTNTSLFPFFSLSLIMMM